MCISRTMHHAMSYQCGGSPWVSYYLAPMRIEGGCPGGVARRAPVLHQPWPQSAYRREHAQPRQQLLRRPLAPPERDDARPAQRRAPFAPARSCRLCAAPTTATGMTLMGSPACGCSTTRHVYDRRQSGVSRSAGLGELLIDVIEKAIARNAEWVTLEVRVSNTSARRQGSTASPGRACAGATTATMARTPTSCGRRRCGRPSIESASAVERAAAHSGWAGDRHPGRYSRTVRRCREHLAIETYRRDSGGRP